MQRFPVRAARLLARAAERDSYVTDLLVRHLRGMPEVLTGRPA
jgi:hypothetical protein